MHSEWLPNTRTVRLLCLVYIWRLLCHPSSLSLLYVLDVTLHVDRSAEVLYAFYIQVGSTERSDRVCMCCPLSSLWEEIYRQPTDDLHTIFTAKVGISELSVFELCKNNWEEGDGVDILICQSYWHTPWVKKGCHHNHGYNFVSSWSICKILSLLQRTLNFQQNRVRLFTYGRAQNI